MHVTDGPVNELGALPEIRKGVAGRGGVKREDGCWLKGHIPDAVWFVRRRG